MKVIKKYKNKNSYFYKLEINNNFFFLKNLQNIELIDSLKNEIEKYQIIKHFSFIPKLYDYNLNKRYILYEYIDGCNFDELQDLSVTEKLKLIYKLIFLVNDLHSINLVHCDLKPSNIIINKFRQLYLIDFGNSTFIGKRAEYGTLKYASKDQLLQKEVTIQFDIYSIGVMLYEIYFPLEKFDNLSFQKLFKNFSKNDKLSILVKDIIYKATNKMYKSLKEMQFDLQKIINK